MIKIAKITDIPLGGAKKIELEDREIAVFNVDGNFFAVDDFCPHRGGPLSEGEIQNGVVICPWHGWEFDLKTGRTPVNPRAKVGCYAVKVEDDDVLILV